MNHSDWWKMGISVNQIPIRKLGGLKFDFDSFDFRILNP